ncbi:MAG TPA: DNA polymerase III subunit beta [Chloroflexi bacterium]|nr:DNA polymerase III subunit beta [Chloroflexota bacterium]
MKVIVKREDLAQGLRAVARAISSRTTLPVLSNVLVATDENRLRLSATDLELAITAWVPAQVEEEGATTVPARTFSDLVGILSADVLRLSYDDDRRTLHVHGGSSETDIRCIEADEFPPLPAPELDEGVMVSVGDFREMVQQVGFAASSDDARPVLTGVFLQVEGGTLTAAASDGYRLSVRKLSVQNGGGADLSLIVPARALNEVARAARDDEEAVVMVAPPGRGQVVFRVGSDVEVVSQLIEGEYPPYEQIIPQRYTTRTVVSTAAFVKACKQAEIFAREGTQSTRLTITPGGEVPGELRISATSESTGSSESTLTATVEGEPITIAFNVRFLREALEAIRTPEVALETTAPASPGVLKPVGASDFIHIIMPMHL